MIQLLLLLGGCPFVYWRRYCLREAGHLGVHWDGKLHHNTPDTWPVRRGKR